MDTQPKVSVLITTYKHERFISQAIESALMQETGFAFEVVIGEDKSPDGTRKIAEEYQQRYPDRIRLLAREQNLGMMRNFVETYLDCRGTYVAILEGDDYWISSKKLQTQVDALDAHPDWVVCFHKVRAFHENGSQPARVLPEDWREVFTLDDLLSQNVIPTCSAMMVRNGVVRKFPDWYFSLSFPDWPFSIMLAQHGKVGCIDQVMAAYRLHEAGAWTGKGEQFRRERILEMLGHIRQVLDRDRVSRVTREIFSGYLRLAEWHVESGSVSKARSALWTLVRQESVLRRGFPYRWALSVVLAMEAPAVLRMISWVRLRIRRGPCGARAHGTKGSTSAKL